MAAIAAAAGSEPPPAGGVPDTYPGLRVHPVEESSAADRATPVISEPTPPEREIAATVQIPRGELMQEPAPPVVAGPRPCPVCGEAVQPGERFCIGCGAQIPPDFFAQAAPPSGWSRPTGSSSGGQPAAPAAQTVECPHCHFVNPIANRFCQGCGSRLAG
jgi:predicted nucleic acid-binding Zn ribbon protein